MKEKIFNFLKTKLAGFAGGVQEFFLLGFADHYAKTINDESQIATTITDGAIDQIKVAYTLYDTEAIRRAAEAQKTALKNFQEKHGLDENGKPIEDPKKKKEVPPNPGNPGDPNDIRKIISDAIAAAVQPLQQKIENQEKEKSRSALAEKVKSHEKIKDIPAWYLSKSNLVPESEDMFDQHIANLESDWNKTRQQMIDDGMVFSTPPAAGGTGGKEGAEVGKKIAEKHNQQILGAKEQAGVKKIV